MNASVEALIRQGLAGLESLPVYVQLLFFFAFAVLQLFVPFVPGDLVLLLGSCFGSLGVLPGGTWTVLISFWMGTVSGCMGLFLLGRRYGLRLLRSRAIRHLFPVDKQQQAYTAASRFGPPVLLGTKFIPGVNSLMLVTGGIMGWRALLVMLYMGVAAFAQELVLFLAGRALGNNLDAIYRFIARYQQVSAALLVLLIAVILWWIVRYYRRAGRSVIKNDERS